MTGSGNGAESRGREEVPRTGEGDPRGEGVKQEVGTKAPLDVSPVRSVRGRKLERHRGVVGFGTGSRNPVVETWTVRKSESRRTTRGPTWDKSGTVCVWKSANVCDKGVGPHGRE